MDGDSGKHTVSMNEIRAELIALRAAVDGMQKCLDTLIRQRPAPDPRVERLEQIAREIKDLAEESRVDLRD